MIWRNSGKQKKEIIIWPNLLTEGNSPMVLIQLVGLPGHRIHIHTSLYFNNVISHEPIYAIHNFLAHK
jgi:hypothetical protein